MRIPGFSIRASNGSDPAAIVSFADILAGRVCVLLRDIFTQNHMLAARPPLEKLA